MNTFLILAFLFFIGSVCGWVLEVIFRRFFSSKNPQRKWINPGFCTGPYLPLYGCGLCLLYLLASLESRRLIADPTWNRVALFACMAIAMTVIEFIAGWVSLHVFHVRLWDYSDQWGNIEGIICPKFSLAWALLGAAYYFLVHPHILNALDWLSKNLAFSFVIGLFFGIFIIDVLHSANLYATMQRFAKENDVVVLFDLLKEHIRSLQEEAGQKYRFFRSFKSQSPLDKLMSELSASFEKRHPKKK